MTCRSSEMWRLLSAIPRVLRQHATGARASASVCVEDDVECSESNEVLHLNDLIRLRLEPCFVTTCNSERSQRRKVYIDDNKRRHQTTHCHFWSHVSSPHAALEVLGLGAAVVLGIEFSKQKWRERYRTTSRRRCPCPFLLYQIAFALPGSRGKKNILETDKKRHVDTGQGEHHPSALSKVMLEFKTMCGKYTAVAKVLFGLQKAEMGQITEAVADWQEASALGYAKAQFNLGLCYETGDGVKQDLQEALQYYHLAAAGGHPEATYNLALLYLNSGKIMRDAKYAIELLEKAAELGVVQAQTYLGIYYTEAATYDMVKAVSFLTAASVQNDAEAQYFLGICYEQGWGVEVDECKAASLFTQAAQDGHDGATYNLAVFNEHGLGGLPVDIVYAKELYLKAVKAGNESALLKLQGMKAREALVEWREKFESFDKESLIPEPSKPIEMKSSSNKGKLGSSASSPTLTVYVKDQLSQITFSKDMWDAKHAISISNVSEAKYSSRSLAVDTNIVFTLGVEDSDSDLDSVNNFEDDNETSSWEVYPSMESCSSVQRNSTMPILGYVPCL